MLIATLRKRWNLGAAFSRRDASARTFETLFSCETPRDPEKWTSVTARPVPDWTMDLEIVGQGLSTLGIGAGASLFDKAKSMGVELPRRLQGSLRVYEAGGDRPGPGTDREPLLPGLARDAP